MALSEQMSQAIDLFWSLYKGFGSNEIKISSLILRENGLENSTFWEVICPEWKEEGVIESIPLPDMEIINQERYDRLDSKLLESIGRQNELRRQYGLYPNEDMENHFDREQKKLRREIDSLIITYYSFKIDPKKLERLKKGSAETESQGSKKNISNKILTKDNLTGNYFIRGKQINSSDSIGYKILDILFEDSDSSGFLSYSDITKKLKDRGVFPFEDKKKDIRRISNAVKDFLRFARVDNKRLGENALGKKIIENVRGKGLRLSYPEIS